MHPSVTLVNVTQDALDMLILAKSTRLEMNPNLLEEIRKRPYEEKMKEVEYIANTIPSSWEFVDFTFLICNVTRGFTHQFVRSRHASFAQQTMRVLNVTGWEYATGPSIEAAPPAYQRGYHEVMERIAHEYKVMTSEENKHSGIKIEDARGILPTNIGTNILVKMNLRTLAELIRKRSSSRVQGEYREVLGQMKDRSLEALPWVRHFIDRTFDRAANELDQMINALPDVKLTSMEQSGIEKIDKLKMIKLLDQMRMQS